MLIGPPSEAPTTAARSEPAASITARTSSIRVSRFAIPATRSDAPVPRLSKMISRLNEAIRSKNAPRAGSSQSSSTFENGPGHVDEIERPVTDDLVGDADVAALRVARLGLHGPSLAGF